MLILSAVLFVGFAVSDAGMPDMRRLVGALARIHSFFFYFPLLFVFCIPPITIVVAGLSLAIAKVEWRLQPPLRN